ncbi:MAG: phosphate ABC transporter ATP-binding protein [Thermoleophilia bacterium]|nr:phosphate ABC transporter ATP-binding protein [Thermoleophilia bacterium]
MIEDVHPSKLAVDELGVVARHGAEDGRRIVDAVSFVVPEGGVFTVVGPSGSGKSTLLRAIVRLVEPDAGRVLLDGRDVTSLPVPELRRRVGMVFQRPAMFEGTVTDNVLYGPRLRREQPERDGPGARDAAVPLLERVGLPADFAGKPADELSGGEAQRVALARALANRPEVLLLDEPTSSLDPTASRCIEELLAALAESTDLTFVFVTHDLHQARRIGDHGLLLVEGRVVERGPLPGMLDDPAHDLTRLFTTGRLGGRTGGPSPDEKPAAGAGPDGSPAAGAGPDGECRLP